MNEQLELIDVSVENAIVLRHPISVPPRDICVVAAYSRHGYWKIVVPNGFDENMSMDDAERAARRLSSCWVYACILRASLPGVDNGPK